MKCKILFFVTFLFFFISIGSLYSQTIPVNDYYIGQTPPGNTPVKFQLQVNSGFFAGDRIAISSDGKEIYYAELNGYPFTEARIKCYTYKDVSKTWNGLNVVVENRYGPAITSDGKTLFCEDAGNKSYTLKRTDSLWTGQTPFLKSITLTHSLQLTSLGNYYLTTNPVISATGDITKLVIKNTDTTIQNLGFPVNSINNGFDFFISPDESYIVRVVKANGVGSLFISYHKPDGNWTNPKTLGNLINPAQAWEWGYTNT